MLGYGADEIFLFCFIFRVKAIGLIVDILCKVCLDVGSRIRGLHQTISCAADDQSSIVDKVYSANRI